jgi:hypothetical protein
MIKELLFAGLAGLSSLALQTPNLKAKEIEFPGQEFYIPIQQKPQQVPKYSDLMGYIDPSTKLPFAKYMADKPYDFVSDANGDYMSKRYKFNDFDCSMCFAVDDMNYTKNENEIEIKLHKYPKYIRLEIPMLLQKTFVDEAQDGIDGKNEKEYVYGAEGGISFGKEDNFYSTPIDGSDFPDKDIGLYTFLKGYLDEKGLPKSEFLTEKPFELSFFKGRLNVAKEYLLDAKINESDAIADMTLCMLYFQVNDADFGDKKERNTIILKLNPNPSYINLIRSEYNSKKDSLTIKNDLWFKDLKMDSINGNEVIQESPKINKDSKLEKTII